MINNVTISVIVPVFNVKDYLVKCINSILSQTFIAFELILIDDGSFDGSSDICDEYVNYDKRVVVVHKNNGGLSSARNYGLKIAKGEYICFVDGDDFVDEYFLEKLLNNIISNNSDISICNYFYESNNKKLVFFKSFNKNFNVDGKNKFMCLHNYYKTITVHAWGKLYKKELFSLVKYPNGKIFEDSYVICELLDKARIVSYLYEPLYVYVHRNSSIVNSFSIHHFDKIGSFNRKINFFTKKGYDDLVVLEKNCKVSCIILNLVKMKYYHIHNNVIYNKYYNELVNTCNEVTWQEASKRTKFFKIFRWFYVWLRYLEYIVCKKDY